MRTSQETASDAENNFGEIHISQRLDWAFPSLSPSCSLGLMNSWGDGWADNGFFRVQNADVLGLEFSDVFWTENDLSKKEKKAYGQHGAEIAARLMASLKGLQAAKYKCPLCSAESKVADDCGHLLRAKCPECGGTFNANQAGGDLALNLYLTSLTYSVSTPDQNKPLSNQGAHLESFGMRVRSVYVLDL